MARRYRCRHTTAYRCSEAATVRVRLTFSIVSTPQVTRLCEAHRVTLESMSRAAGIGFEVLPSPAAVKVRKAIDFKF